MPFGLLTRDAPLTVTAEPFTVTAVVATATPVNRRDARGAFREVLDPAGADLSDLDVPVQDNHARDRALATIGRATNFRREGDAIVADLTFSTAPDVENIVARVRDKTLRNVSAGYSVARWQETVAGGTRTRTATAWSIREVSLVALPADPNSKLRGEHMEPDTTTLDPAEVERTRRSDIRGIARSAGLDAEWADDMIDRDADVTTARAAAFEAMQTRTAPVIRTSAPANDDPAVIRERREAALYARMTGTECPAEARAFAHDTFLDHARGFAEGAGISTRGMSSDENLHRSTHSTSDFALTVSNVAGKSMMQSYQLAASPLKRLARSRTLSNFKTATSIRHGELGRLEEVAENGEITATTRTEQGEELRLKTYARQIGVSRQLLVDDDLGLFNDLTSAFGESAAATEADLLVETLVANGSLKDGAPVFDASRGNLATTGVDLGSAGGKGALSDARESMRKMVGLDGVTPVNATPRFLLVGPELETDAEELLAMLYPKSVEDVNVFSQRLDLLVEPRLTGAAWYVFADPARLPVLQIARMAGAAGP